MAGSDDGTLLGDPECMRVLESLRSEHRVMAGVLGALDAYADELEHSTLTDTHDAREFARFFTEFCDLWHHAKEEEFLFPALVRHGLSWDDGCVAASRREHQQEAYLSRVLFELANRETSPDEREHRRELIRAMHAYSTFQREHMRAEETELYPRAGEVIPSDELGEIEQACRELEAHRFATAGYGELLALADALGVRHVQREHVARAGRAADGARRLPDLFGRATIVLGGHVGLRRQVEELRRLCTGLSLGDRPVEGFVEQLDTLCEQLLAHFAAEEGEAYFGGLAVESPSIAHRIEQLTRAHGEMSEEMVRLRAWASAGPVDASLARAVECLLDRLGAHEHEETLLLQEFFLHDKSAVG